MFKNIYLEITNICNLNCSFCPTLKRRKTFMSLSDFEKISKKIFPLTEMVSLYLMGEPTIHPEFSKILKLCEPYGAKVQLTTNGLNIKNVGTVILSSKAIKQVNFSVQCFKDNFLNKDFKNYLKDVLDFVVLANEKNKKMYVNLRLWNMGAGDENNEAVFLFLEDFFKIEIKRKVELFNIKTKRIWNNFSLSFDSRFTWPSLDAPFNSELGTCYGLKGHFGILVDGTVVPCCLDSEGVIALGNCLKEDLSTILESPRAKAIRGGFNKGVLKEDLCKHCSFIKRFSRV